jgi:hypothetical protein
MPDEGQMCLVMTGDQKDLGRMAVLRVMQSRVRIGYCDIETGVQKERQRRPSFLIYLQDRLEVVNNELGWVWIQYQRGSRRSRIEQVKVK